MELNRNTAVILLGLVVVASGCASGENDTGPASTQAVSVMNYSAVPGTVFDSQQTSLRLRLKNVGEGEATNVQAKIFGPPFGNPSEQEWKVMTVNPSSEGTGDRVIDFNTLRPADEEAGVPATPREGIVTLQPPNLDEGVTIPYDIFARVAYKYQNRGVTEIQLMGDQRYRKSNVERSQPTLENTDGPIHMEIRTRTPIVFYGEGQTTSSNLCVIVRNEGTGTPYMPSETTTDPSDSVLNKVQLTINSAGSIGFRPAGSSEAKEKTPVDLVGNKGIQCFEFTNLQEEFTTDNIQKTLPITLEADYNYYKETQTSVTVKGTKAGATSGDS